MAEEERKKLEFMAAVKLVPPAVLEEIHRRQMVCRAELGNWWERQHSKDFCLVPINQGSWSSSGDKPGQSSESVHAVDINDVPTPDYAIEITSQDYCSTNSSGQVNNTNGIPYFMTTS
ncbi:PREDICTED: uncharacterized protein LOC109581534 [Amphimedon queenslandica]|uniref:Uncharacterized protein n=1 Tax=Amphimedon queenslandica TaxID=400682 RepID=A0A1X7V0J0_AMPQE|nr:PREDICTED: uncharacterized protein LOC109581534 [Amphimedon queenslandica]|eukprot:XP_019851289.1 PREDICTED: uncharacterized protein LOC109581534 [Amphimedon queenslandica]